MGDRDAKRAELLRAAAAVIARDGYAAASLRKVADQAGCTTGAVTYYFANKEEMVTAVAENLFDEFDELLEAGRSGTDVRTILERWLDRTNTDDSGLWLVLFQLLAHARHEPAFADVIQRRYARFRELLATILETGQRGGTVRRDIEPNLLADQLSAMCDGWMLMLPIERGRFTRARVRALVDAAVTLVSRPAGKR